MVRSHNKTAREIIMSPKTASREAVLSPNKMVSQETLFLIKVRGWI